MTDGIAMDVAHLPRVMNAASSSSGGGQLQGEAVDVGRKNKVNKGPRGGDGSGLGSRKKHVYNQYIRSYP